MKYMKLIIGSIITAAVLAMFIFAFIPSMNTVARNMDDVCTAPSVRIGSTYTDQNVPAFIEFDSESPHVYMFSVMGYVLVIDLTGIYRMFRSIPDMLWVVTIRSIY